MSQTLKWIAGDDEGKESHRKRINFLKNDLEDFTSRVEISLLLPSGHLIFQIGDNEENYKSKQEYSTSQQNGSLSSNTSQRHLKLPKLQNCGK